MEDIIKGYRQILGGAIGLLALLPGFAFLVALATVAGVYLCKMVKAIIDLLW
jgi:hypothetical protein